jgi:hypothetical protein
MFKFIAVMGLISSFSFNLFAAEAIKVIDILIRTDAITETLVKYGFKNEKAVAQGAGVAEALKSLGAKDNFSGAELKKILAALPIIDTKDATKRTELVKLLESPVTDKSKKEILDAINSIYYLANGYGKSIFITCERCVGETAAEMGADGIKYSVTKIKDAKKIQIISKAIGNSPEETNRYIKNQMKTQGLGDYSKVTSKEITPDMEKSFARYLVLAANGTEEEKNLAKALKKLSTDKSGKTNILQNRLWTMASGDLTPDTMTGLTETFTLAAERVASKGMNAEEAFYEELAVKAKGNKYLLEQLDSLKKQGCFFFKK